MNALKIVLPALLLAFFIPDKVFAQLPAFYPLLTMEIKVSGADTLPDGELTYSDSTLFNTHILIDLFDTTGISKIHVLLKKTEQSPVLLEQSYDFASLNRNGYSIDMALGNYAGLLRYYGEAVIEMTDGSMTEPFKVWR